MLSNNFDKGFLKHFLKQHLRFYSFSNEYSLSDQKDNQYVLKFQVISRYLSRWYSQRTKRLTTRRDSFLFFHRGLVLFVGVWLFRVYLYVYEPHSILPLLRMILFEYVCVWLVGVYYNVVAGVQKFFSDLDFIFDLQVYFLKMFQSCIIIVNISLFVSPEDFLRIACHSSPYCLVSRFKFMLVSFFYFTLLNRDGILKRINLEFFSLLCTDEEHCNQYIFITFKLLQWCIFYLDCLVLQRTVSI